MEPNPTIVNTNLKRNLSWWSCQYYIHSVQCILIQRPVLEIDSTPLDLRKTATSTSIYHLIDLPHVHRQVAVENHAWLMTSAPVQIQYAAGVIRSLESTARDSRRRYQSCLSIAYVSFSSLDRFSFRFLGFNDITSIPNNVFAVWPTLAKMSVFEYRRIY